MLPLLEERFSFSKNEDGYRLETPAEDKKRLVFGIRPCDARALSIIDMGYGDGYQDNYYMQRRRNTLLVGLGCTRPYDSCFCTSLDSHPHDASAVDIMLTDIGGGGRGGAHTPPRPGQQ